MCVCVGVGVGAGVGVDVYGEVGGAVDDGVGGSGWDLGKVEQSNQQVNECVTKTLLRMRLNPFYLFFSEKLKGELKELKNATLRTRMHNVSASFPCNSDSASESSFARGWHEQEPARESSGAFIPLFRFLVFHFLCVVNFVLFLLGLRILPLFIIVIIETCGRARPRICFLLDCRSHPSG